MKNSEQWLKERCVPEGPLWDKQQSWKEWIEAIQVDSFNEGVIKSSEMCGGDSHIEYGVLSLLKNPFVKSQPDDHTGT